MDPINHPKYIYAIETLKESYQKLPWYQRFWFNLWSFRLARALSKLDQKKPTKEQCLALRNKARNAWFFKPIFGLFDPFCKSIDKCALTIDDATRVRLNQTIRHLEQVKNLDPWFKRGIEENADNKPFEFFFCFSHELTPQEANRLWEVLINNRSNSLFAKNIKGIGDLLLKGKNGSILNIKNVFLLIEELQKLSSDNREILFDSRRAEHLGRSEQSTIFDAIKALVDTNLLTQETLDQLRTHAQRNDLFNVIHFSHMKGALDKNTLPVIMNHQKLKDVADYFKIYGFVYYKNGSWVKDWVNTKYRLKAEQFLNVLTVSHPYNFLLSQHAFSIVKRIPNDAWKFDKEEQLIPIEDAFFDACTKEDPRQALLNMKQDIIEKSEGIGLENNHEKKDINYDERMHNAHKANRF